VLLGLAREREDIALVGGAVRDLLLGRTPRELDVTVAGRAAELAHDLAERLGQTLGEGADPPRTVIHERFGTASVDWVDGCVDIAERREESYLRPGALPEVRRGDQEADLARRDFTVNAIAVHLGGRRRGELEAVEHALEDLEAGRLRVLHEASFIDDPTRLLRLARYRARLDFEIEPRTAEMARQALARGALGTVSGARAGAELWLATEEGEPLAALMALGELGALSALGLPARFDVDLAREALRLLPPDGSRDVVLMAVLFHPPADEAPERREAAAELMGRLEFSAETRERVLASAFGVGSLVDAVQRTQRPSQLRALLGGRPVEAAAVAGALGARSSPDVPDRIVRWLTDLRHVHLEIGGEELLAAGVPEGPQIGRLLDAVLARRLDGELADGREAELQAALEAGE
jgi:tRNA nucleotidyltransferase (CCA-adding enzyme)